MKNRDRISKDNARNGDSYQKSDGAGLMNQKSKMKMKMHRARMGGGLSLQAFANAKTKNDGYNPALIKKQREFYKNAKYVNKYKKSLKQQDQELGPSSSATKLIEDSSENREAGEINQGKRKNRSKAAFSLKEIYEKKQEQQEKARMEREAIIQAKKEEKERSEARRKDLKGKMLKRTRFGQPVMKYRIEHLLETIEDPKR